MLLLEQFEHLTLHPKNTAKLKELVLQLAVQGKLTENWRKQNPAIEPASELLKRIEAEKAQLVKEKKIKKIESYLPVSEKEKSVDLPEGWAWYRFGEVTINRDSERIPLSKPEREHRQGEYDYYGASGVIDTIDEYLFDKDLLLIGEDGANLINRSTPIAFIASGKYWVNNHAHVIDAVDFRILKYLEVFINSINLEVYITGMAQPKMNQKYMNSIPVAFPPLAEQEAIVARVEELMHKIEELEQLTEWRLEQKKNLGAAALQKLTAAADEDLPQHWHFLQQHFRTIFDEPANVKKLRETILQLAVQGKLTTTWRKQNPTTEPASELLKRIQEEKAKLVKEKKLKKEKPMEPVSEDEVPYELPEGWVWCRLGELSNTFLGGYSYKSPLFISEGNNQVLRLGNVKNDKLLLDSAPVFIDEKLAEDSIAFELLPEDILVTMTGTRAKRDYCFTTLIDESYFENRRLFLNQRVGCFRLNNYNNKNYIIKSLKVSNLLDSVFDSATGTANQANIGKEALVNMLIPLPPFAEQEAIVTKVDQLMQLCDELEQQLQQSKKEAEALMQAVVQEALQVQEEVV